MPTYTPQKGDFVAVTFDPQSGHEQRGRRPALVVSNTLFNKHTGLTIVCPLTNTDRNFPFHVAIVNDPNVTGFVMVGARGSEPIPMLDPHNRSRALRALPRGGKFRVALPLRP